MMVGDTVSANPGTWGPAPVATTVQWLRDGTVIPGATGTTYRLSDADVGKALRVDVTGTKAGYTTARASSASTATVRRRELVQTSPPALTGDPLIGGQLTVSPGTWSPSGVTTTIQWTRGGQPISGATGTTYRPTNADHRQLLGAIVTVSHPSVPSQVRTLAASGPARAIPLIKVNVEDAKPKKSKKLVIVLRWAGNPVAGPVTITEAGQPVTTLQVPAKGIEYVYRSTKGVHALQFAFGGADGYAPTTATVSVRIK
jgi:hypothetical protein